jgi:hypothetical protein
MKRTFILCSFLFGSILGFAQPFTSSPGLYIPVSGANSSGLFVQGQSGVDGNITLEGLGSAQIFWLSAGNNLFKIGGNGGSEPAMGVINIDGNSGHVGINTLNTSGFTFNVNGTAVCDGMTVMAFSGTNPKSTPWADYVFDKNYQLPSIYSVAAYIKANSHLPGIPTTAEVKKNGLDLAANQAQLLEKIEQLTLYTIELQRQADESRAENEKLSTLFQAQNEKLSSLQQQIDGLKRAGSKN